MQKENYELRNQLKKLQLEYNTLSVGQRKAKRPISSSSKGSSDVPESTAQLDNEVAKHGRKYSILVCPWIDANIFHALNSCPNVDYTSEDRFRDEQSMLEGTQAELYNFLPTKLHVMMDHRSHFVPIVRFYLLKLYTY